MGKYSTFQKKKEREKQGIHPVWRGIGFIFIVITPVLGYAATEVLLMENAKRGWMQIPLDLVIKGQYPLLLVKTILTLFFMFLIYVLFTLLTFLLSSLFAPPQYGPMDVRELPRKPRRKR